MPRAEARFDIKAEDKFSKNFAKAKKGLGGLSTSALTAAKSFGALAGVAGFGALTRGAMTLGSELTHVSDRLGIGVEAVSALRATAMDTGSTMNTLERGLRNFKERIAKAADGSKSLQAALKSVNLEAADLSGIPLEQGLTRFANAIINADDQSKAFLATQQILGVKAGPELIQLLKALGDGWDEYSDKMKKAGRVMDEETARSLESAETNIAIAKDIATIKWGWMLGKAMEGGKVIKGFRDMEDPGIPIWKWRSEEAGKRAIPAIFQGSRPEPEESAAPFGRGSTGSWGPRGSTGSWAPETPQKQTKRLEDMTNEQIRILEGIEQNTARAGVFGGTS